MQRDLEDFFRRLAPDNDPRYRHTIEGPDDMPAHIRAALTQTHLSIPLHQGRLALGTWQGVYLFEHRDASPCALARLHLLGEPCAKPARVVPWFQSTEERAR